MSSVGKASGQCLEHSKCSQRIVPMPLLSPSSSQLCSGQPNLSSSQHLTNSFLKYESYHTAPLLKIFQYFPTALGIRSELPVVAYHTQCALLSPPLSILLPPCTSATLDCLQFAAAPNWLLPPSLCSHSSLCLDASPHQPCPSSLTFCSVRHHFLQTFQKFLPACEGLFTYLPTALEAYVYTVLAILFCNYPIECLSPVVCEFLQADRCTHPAQGLVPSHITE